MHLLSRFSSLLFPASMQADQPAHSFRYCDFMPQRRQNVLHVVFLVRKLLLSLSANQFRRDDCMFLQSWKATRMSRACCGMCDNREIVAICKECYNAWYCSGKHRQEDLPSHKLLCKEWKKAWDAYPGITHHLAISFPEHEQSPKWIWIPYHCKSDGQDPGLTWASSPVRKLLGDDSPFPSRCIVRIDEMHSEPLDFPLEIVAREKNREDGSHANQSLLKAASIKEPKIWRGLLIVLRTFTANDQSPKYDDMTLEDYHHAIDYMVKYGDDTLTSNGSKTQ